jgi:hypothetical protein
MRPRSHNTKNGSPEHNINAILKKFAIRLAMRRPAPTEIPMARISGRLTRNYFSVYLGDSDEPRKFVVQRINNFGLSGLWFNDPAQVGNAASIPYDCLKQFDLVIVYYLDELEFLYTSAPGFILKQVSIAPYLSLLQERFIRFLYNKRRLFRSDRIKVLTNILEETLNDDVIGVTASGLLRDLYGHRWILHPDNENLHRYYQLLLDSLVESNDLVRQTGYYTVTPNALTTLAAYEEDDRRHRDQMRQQKVLAFLTLSLVFVGFVQAYINWSS